jgi:hypothetical protein
VAVRHRSISFSQRNPLLTKESRSSVFNLAFFHSLDGLGCRATTLGQTLPLHYRPSSSPHHSSCSLTGMPSSSKCKVSSLVFAWGLHWWWTAAAHLDLFYCAAAAEAV